MSGASEIHNCHATTGAGVSIEGSEFMMQGYSRIHQNKAFEHGAGISLSSSSTWSAENSRIDGNTADGDGGGVHSVQDATVEIQSTSIDGNIGKNGGGFWGMKFKKLWIFASTFSSNKATGSKDSSGGGLYLHETKTSVHLEDLKFEGNIAETGVAIMSTFADIFRPSGGGLYLSAIMVAEWVAKSLFFTKNVARGDGGGATLLDVFCLKSGGQQSPVAFSNLTMESNVCSKDGGSLALLGTTDAEFVNSTMILNNLAQPTAAEFVGWHALWYGKAYCLQDCDEHSLQMTEVGLKRISKHGGKVSPHCF